MLNHVGREYGSYRIGPERESPRNIEIMDVPEYALLMLRKAFGGHFSNRVQEPCREGNSTNKNMGSDVCIVPSLPRLIEASKVQLHTTHPCLVSSAVLPALPQERS
jgi:hypothetical protein